MSWKSFSDGKVEYDLSHLDPFTLSIGPLDAGQRYKVLVQFGCHTFTEMWCDGDDPTLRFVNGDEQRRFCTVRHGHSKHLRPILTRARKAYFTGERNYLIAENLPGLTGLYAVFFNIARSKIAGVDAALFVVSAYEKPALPPRRSMDSISLTTLVHKTVHNEPVKRPPKRK